MLIMGGRGYMGNLNIGVNLKLFFKSKVFKKKDNFDL